MTFEIFEYSEVWGQFASGLKFGEVDNWLLLNIVGVAHSKQES